VQSKRVWGRVIGAERDVVIEAVEFDDGAGEIVVSCRLRRDAGRRCGQCGRRCGRYDQGEGRRRVLDAGRCGCSSWPTLPVLRVPDHGVTVAAVPWARHAAGHTRVFDDQVAWLVTHTSKSAVVE
jgi:transposase